MKRTDELKAGIFITLGLALFAATIFIMGSERQIFARLDDFFTTFRDVKGLSEGAPVRLGGITVGRVASIGFSQDPSDVSIHVRFFVNSKFLERIHTDSEVTIETQGLLGDKFLNISPGIEIAPLPPGSTMKSSEPAEIAGILSKAGVIVENTVEASHSFNEFAKSFNNDALPAFSKAASSIASLAAEIEKGDGLMHRLIYSQKDGDSIINGISGTSKSLSSILSELESGSGLLHALIYDPKGTETLTAFGDAARNFSIALTTINELTAEIKTGHGLLHSMIYEKSPEGINDVVKKLNETASNLKKASEALTQGSGTIGALLFDPQLYDNLVEVTDGAKRSIILRQAIRSSLEK